MRLPSWGDPRGRPYACGVVDLAERGKLATVRRPYACGVVDLAERGKLATVRRPYACGVVSILSCCCFSKG